MDDEWKCSNDLETATDPDGNLVNYLQVMDEEQQAANTHWLSTSGLCLTKRAVSIFSFFIV